MATKIESNKVSINATQEEIFNFLTNFNNIEQLLPEDKISDWNSDFDSCSFKIQNAAIIPLVKDKVTPFEEIQIISGEKAPFIFTLRVTILKTNETCEGSFIFEGEINAFLKMMVVKPLTNLFNYMADRLQEIHA
jgi:hypothetical protein